MKDEKKWFRNTSISLIYSENLWLKGEKEGKTSLNLLSMLTIGLLIVVWMWGYSVIVDEVLESWDFLAQEASWWCDFVVVNKLIRGYDYRVFVDEGE